MRGETEAYRARMRQPPRDWSEPCPVWEAARVRSRARPRGAQERVRFEQHLMFHTRYVSNRRRPRLTSVTPVVPRSPRFTSWASSLRH